MTGTHDAMWSQLADAAEHAGLNVRVAVERSAVDASFTRAQERAGAVTLRAPADVCPGYRSALVLGSAGRPLWERLQGLDPLERNLPDPLDHLAERSTDSLLQILREADPPAQAAYPHRHAHQLVPFQALTEHLPWTQLRPLGILVHPAVGPWFAWRAVLLTTLEAPTELEETRESPCVTCPAPCVTACPSGAVHKRGFQWETCATYRLEQTPCRETCLARQACPAGADYRYGADQLRYHYGGSFRMIQRWAASRKA